MAKKRVVKKKALAPSSSHNQQANKHDYLSSTPQKAALAATTEPQDDVRQGMSTAELRAMLEDLEIEASSRLRLLQKKQTERLSAMSRHWHTGVATLDDSIRHLTLGDFIDLYDCDKENALRAVASQALQHQEAASMGQVEQSARKRKRTLQTSSQKYTASAEDDDATATFDSMKKARGHASFSQSNKRGLAPTQRGSFRSRSREVGQNGSSPASASRPSRSRLALSAAAPSGLRQSNGNFIYRVRASMTFNPALPSTPSVSRTAARQPRRGESIVLRSVNDSPLGEFVASDVEYDEDDIDADEQGEKEGSHDWDMMGWDEASREVNDMRKGKTSNRLLGKAKQKQTKTSKVAKGKNSTSEPEPRRSARSRSSSTTVTATAATELHRMTSTFVPSSEFTYAPPVNAPAFEELLIKQANEFKATWIKQMRETLDKTQMSAQERARLEEKFQLDLAGMV